MPLGELIACRTHQHLLLILFLTCCRKSCSTANPCLRPLSSMPIWQTYAVLLWTHLTTPAFSVRYQSPHCPMGPTLTPPQKIRSEFRTSLGLVRQTFSQELACAHRQIRLVITRVQSAACMAVHRACSASPILTERVCLIQGRASDGFLGSIPVTPLPAYAADSPAAPTLCLPLPTMPCSTLPRQTAEPDSSSPAKRKARKRDPAVLTDEGKAAAVAVGEEVLTPEQLAQLSPQDRRRLRRRVTNRASALRMRQRRQAELGNAQTKVRRVQPTDYCWTTVCYSHCKVDLAQPINVARE